MTCYIPSIAESLARYNDAKNFAVFVKIANRKAHQNAFCSKKKCDCDFEFPDDCNFECIANKYKINCDKCCTNPLEKAYKCGCCNFLTPDRLSRYKLLILKVLERRLNPIPDPQPDIDFNQFLPDKLCCGKC
jgi:hypothetical protein